MKFLKKFKFNQSVAGPNFAYKTGDEVVLDAEQAENWQACGYGAIVDGKKE